MKDFEAVPSNVGPLGQSLGYLLVEWTKRNSFEKWTNRKYVYVIDSN